jgi:hypothetical protein
MALSSRRSLADALTAHLGQGGSVSRNLDWWESGVTGFAVDTPPAQMDRRAFLRWAHELARDIPGTLEELPVTSIASFHTWKLTTPESVVWLLWHRTRPFVAGVEEAPVAGQPLRRFVDVPEGAPAARFGLVALRAVELRGHLTNTDLDALPEVEREQIRYWKPATRGEAAFNWWD